MTKDEIFDIAKEHFSSIEYDDGVVHECYEFSFKELVAFAKLIAEKEREHLIKIGLIGVLKHCEDLLREDGHEDAMNDVQEMISKISARGQE